MIQYVCRDSAHPSQCDPIRESRDFRGAAAYGLCIKNTDNDTRSYHGLIQENGMALALCKVRYERIETADNRTKWMYLRRQITC